MFIEVAGLNFMFKLLEKVHPSSSCTAHASFVVLDHAGHLVEIEQETIVTPLVQEWLHRSLVVRETVCV